MYLLYVDESGDTGINNSPTNYFILSGLVIHELRWKIVLEQLIEFRRYIKETKGLKLREEIHSSAMIVSPGDLFRIKKNDRLDILKKCLSWLSTQSEVSIINIVTNKTGKTEDIFEKTWQALIQRFENTIRYRNFPGPQNPDERGLIIPDNTDNKKLQQLIRKMRRYNPIPNNSRIYPGGSRNLTLEFVIEDPFFKNSEHSYFHQMVDVVAYSVKQLYEPNKYIRNKGAAKMMYVLDPVLCKHASKINQYGIVEL